MRFRFLLFLLIFVLATSLVAFAPLPLPRKAPVERSFQVIASSYDFSPAEMRVNPGDRITIELTSSDVVHGLYLDGYNLQVSADPGQTETLIFTADRSGTFRFRCSVTCGDLHPFMIGKLHVGPNTLLWRGMGLVFLALVGLATIGANKFRSQPDVSPTEPKPC